MDKLSRAIRSLDVGMKVNFYLKGKKVSEKEVISVLGEEKTKRYIQLAKEGFRKDPEEEQSWFLGSAGELVIEFS